MRYRYFRGAIAPAIIICCFLVFSSPAAAFVPPAGEYYGTVTIDGSPAPAGTQIQAIINGQVRGSIVTSVPGQYGSSCLFATRLIVQPTEADSASHQPIRLEFLINGVKADQTMFFSSGIRSVSLSMHHPDTPSPTPTPTVTTQPPTATPTPEPTLKAPVAEINGDPLSGNAPLDVWFRDVSGNDPARWNWSFGDGTFSTEQNPTHRYVSPGAYTVTLTVWNDAGNGFTAEPGFVRVTGTPFLMFPGSGRYPDDLDGDGKYEDLNGNGGLDFLDVILYFNNMDWIAQNEPEGIFDYNGNGNIDFNDLLILFDRV
ncbi:PKD repeat protein [Methanolinea mesophila]|uniref:PKD domain-containing protein n=1 Tax=Methanolinea mesophila TaxID=547055 RepID=UPI0024743764|nr:PKD domain-containing protein [Methanolinea mesophila]MBP1927589.1 PKD repeat protein [Methanolinea mesophila]